MIYVGFDFGSKNLHAAVLRDRQLLETYSLAHAGETGKTFQTLVEQIQAKFGAIERYGICGSISLGSIRTVDTILAAVEANRFVAFGENATPKDLTRNILQIGCETFYLALLDEKGDYIEHTANPMCASGTGSFLDQQAQRIGMETETLAQAAMEFDGPTPSIATRCAVFAKSDIIHAQADGFSKDAIAAGLCEGLAAGVLASVLKGRRLDGGVRIVGGVAENKKIVSEIQKRLGSNIRVVKDEHPTAFHAIGAAILGENENLDVEQFVNSIRCERKQREPLDMKLDNYPDFSQDETTIQHGIEITVYEKLQPREYRVFIGIDIGSTSTKVLVLDENQTVLLGLYTRTAGEPVVVTRNLLEKIAQHFSQCTLTIRGVGTTGSGRKLVGQIFGADRVINEITAHARGAVFLDPEVDTIIEIGGQDSKFTLLRNGHVTSSTMNYVCAAGTGSFIEEQALRLGIGLDEIEPMAVGRRAPFTSDRCTVYMERDLNTLQSEGFSREEIITAVLHSVRDNYLSKVVGKTPIGKRVFFQGATAKNKALVAAFADELGCEISVSRFCHLTGALGVAIMLQEAELETSSFVGVDLDVDITRETCELCVNRCPLTVYEVAGHKTAWGLKCGRDYEDQHVGRQNRQSQLERDYDRIFALDSQEQTHPTSKKEVPTVGIPKTLYMAELYPLFNDFFQRLGFRTVLQKPTTQAMAEGKRVVNSDFCAPLVLAHGMVAALAEKGVDFIFLPAMISEQTLWNPEEDHQPITFLEKRNDACFCYYSSYAATIVDHLTAIDVSDRLLAPMIRMNRRPIETVAHEVAEYLGPRIDIPVKQIATAFREALQQYREATERWHEHGEKLLGPPQKHDKPKILLLGRPYSVFDSEINLGIPASLESAGFDVLYQSMLQPRPEECPEANRFLEKMHWFYGQQILMAAETAARSDDLYPIFLTCFRCSPDSYLLTYVKEICNYYQKPFLVIQLDEHTSDVGYQTRIEAAIETFNADYESRHPHKSGKAISHRNDDIMPGDTVLMPFISSVFTRLQAAVFSAHGYDGRVIPLDETMIHRGYRFASGGECMPNVAIIGSTLDYIEKEKLDPEKTIVFMPNLCMNCNLNQFSILLENALAKSDLSNVRVFNSSIIGRIENVSKELNVELLQVNILSSLLYKLYFRFAAYESTPGMAKAALDVSLALVETDLAIHRPLTETARSIRARFAAIDLDLSSEKPRVAIIGDLYAKYNEVLNLNLFEMILDMGCEPMMPSYIEMMLHFFECDRIQNHLSAKYKRGTHLFERRFENIFADLLPDRLEPSIEDCHSQLERFGIEHLIAGETSINVGRVLYDIEHDQIDAVVHLNPLFCCPGVVSASIFRKIQAKTGIPIVDLFYDGNNRPNHLLIPQLHSLVKRKASV